MCFLNGSEEIVCGKRDEIQLKGFVVDTEDRFEYLERYSDTVQVRVQVRVRVQVQVQALHYTPNLRLPLSCISLEYKSREK